MAAPALRVELGFGSTWRTADADIVWTDVTDKVNDRRQLIDVMRGATAAHGTAGTGTIGLTLNNADRRFDPLHAAGPYHGQLLPGVPIRLVGEVSAVDYAVARGFVQGWPQHSDKGGTMTVVPVDCLDGFQNLARAPVPTSVLDLAIKALSPLHYWPLDGEGNVTTVHDVSGRADGTVVDEPRFGESPLFEGLRTSADFDGENDRIDVADAPLIEDPFHCSVVAVVDPDTAGTADLIRPIYAENDGNGPGADTQVVLYVASSGYVQFTYTVEGQGFTVQSGSSIVATAPHLVFAQSNVGEADDWGVAVDTATLHEDTVTGVFNGGQGAAIGGQPNAARSYSDNHFDGRISNVAIWDVVLTEADRQTLVDAIDAWTDDRTDTRLGRILDFIGWPADLRDFEVGRSTLGPASFDDDSALDYARLIEVTEGGRLFIDAAGQLRFLDRLWGYTSAAGSTSAITFTDDPAGNGYATFMYDLDDELVVNAATYSRRGGETVRIEDEASQELHGIREDRQSDLLLRTDAEVRSRAHWTVTTRSEALPRVKSIEIPLHAYDAAAQAIVLGLDLGHRVTAHRTPQGVGSAIELDFTIDGIRHDIGVAEWWVELYVSPAPDQNIDLFTLGTSTLGGTHVLAH